MFEQGDLGKFDEYNVLKWLTVSAELGNKEAQFKVSQIWLQKAAQQGHPEALERLHRQSNPSSAAAKADESSPSWTSLLVKGVKLFLTTRYF